MTYEVALTRDAERDLEDIPEELRRELTMHFVDTVDEVLGYVLRSRDEAEPAQEKHPERTVLN